MKNETDIKDRIAKPVQIKTEKQVYHNSAQETIRFTALNASQQTLFYLSPAVNVTLQRFEDGEWKDLGPWYAVIAVVPEKTALPPGAEFPVIPLISNHELVKTPGKYRICLNMFTDHEVQNSLQLENRVSNTFEIIH